MLNAINTCDTQIYNKNTQFAGDVKSDLKMQTLELKVSTAGLRSTLVPVSE